MKKKLFDLLIEGIEEENNNQDMASGDEISLEKEAVRTPGERMVDASSINSLEFEALVTFLADRVLKIYPEDVKSSRFQITSEDSAILHPNAAPKVSLGFSDDGTHIDADYDDKLYFFVGYTLANFQRDFGTGEAGQAIGEGEVEEINVSSDAYQRMDGLVPQSALKAFIQAAQIIVRDLQAEGFDDDDIYDYLNSFLKGMNWQ